MLNLENSENKNNLEKLPLIDQAAIVLLSMDETQAGKVLSCLEREDLLTITKKMSQVSGIQVESVKDSLQNFFDDYRSQSGVHGASRDFLKKSLVLALGNNIADTVLNNIYGDEIRPKMAKSQWASPKWLASQLELEHPRMQAIFLAFLPENLAGEVVKFLPENAHQDLLLNVAKLSEIDKDLLEQLEILTDQYLEDLGNQGIDLKGIKQAANLVNRIPCDKKQLLQNLRSQDQKIASEIEMEMYDFFLLSQQPENILTQIVEVVPVELWSIALKGAEAVIRKAILDTMPKRQAQLFEDQMKRSGPVPLSRVEEARKEIMEKVKELAESGEIEIQLFSEAVVE